MVLTHLRRNVVAYLALIVALSTGTAYAAGLANGSVTTQKLATNAVTSAKIKNHKVRAADLKAGVVPLDGFVSVTSITPLDPNPDPNDLPGIFMQNVAVPRAAPTYLRFFATKVGISCVSGDGYVSLSIDGQPVPGTRIKVQPVSGAAPVEVVAITPMTAGQHELSIDGDCPMDNHNGVTGLSGGSWTVMLTAS